ncbi:hypothetical protein ACPUVO_02490 [Pseudocolwellia sp. HL-MZ19]|uniref:hypothetical protein n=1 Tax=unclassified Pseudocolwellia TaxID=2848178 RepID=UPI003CEBEB8B
MMSKFISVSLLVMLSACTSQQLYNHTKLQIKTHCDTKVGVEKEQCVEQANTKSYKEYEKERSQIIGDK